MAEAEKGIKGFLYPHMYRHERVMHVMNDAAGVVRDLFATLPCIPKTCRTSGIRICRTATMTRR